MTFLLLSLQFVFLYFFFLSDWLGLPIQCRIKVAKVGILKRNAFSFSPLSMILAVDLSYMAFIMLKYVLSVPTFWRVFIVNGCWSLWKGFFCICWVHFVNVVYHIYLFADIEKSFHPWDKFQLIVGYDPFNVLLKSVC